MTKLEELKKAVDAHPELIAPADEAQLDRLDKLLVNVRTDEFDAWRKESDDGAEEESK